MQTPAFNPAAPAKPRPEPKYIAMFDEEEAPARLDLKVPGQKKILVSNALGSYYINDPSHQPDDFDPERIFLLHGQVLTINMEDLQGMLLLCAHYAKQCLEVTFVLICRGNEIRILLPHQSVSGTHCAADYTKPCLSIADLEEVDTGGMDIVRCGTIHSHHSMPPSPSSVDDGSELHQAGLHGIVGSMQSLRAAAADGDQVQGKIALTITANGHRYSVRPEAFLTESMWSDFSLRPVPEDPWSWKFSLDTSKNNPFAERHQLLLTAIERGQYVIAPPPRPLMSRGLHAMSLQQLAYDEDDWDMEKRTYDKEGNIEYRTTSLYDDVSEIFDLLELLKLNDGLLSPEIKEMTDKAIETLTEVLQTDLTIHGHAN